jgi:hypothetical protein
VWLRYARSLRYAMATSRSAIQAGGGARPLRGIATPKWLEGLSACCDAKSPWGGIGNAFALKGSAIRFTDDAAMLNCATVGLGD